MSANPNDKSLSASDAVETDEAQEQSHQESGKLADSSGAAFASSDSSVDSIHSAETPPRTFEDLTLSELVAQFLRSPARTWRRLQVATKAPAGTQHAISSARDAALASSYESTQSRTSRVIPRRYFGILLQPKYVRLLVYLTAFIFAFAGSAIARGTEHISRNAEFSLQVGAPFLWLGFLLWLVGDIFGHFPQIKSYWRDCDRLGRLHWLARIIPAVIMLGSLHLLAQSMAAPSELAADMAASALRSFIAGAIILLVVEAAFRRARLFKKRAAPDLAYSPRIEQVWIATRSPRRRSILLEMSHLRKHLLVAAMLCSAYVWENTSGNRIEVQTIMVWLLSAALWGFCFAPLRWNIFDWATGRVDAWRRINWRRHSWALVAFALIMIVGFVLRFMDLESSPPQLISDHVELFLNAHGVRYKNIFPILFTTVSSLEPIHNYSVAAMSYLPGLDLNQYTFSLVSAIEGLITLPLLFWLALEVMRQRRSKFSIAFALIVTALATISYWHIHMSRSGFRLPLSPLFVTASLIFYARALRHNLRSDYVKSGLFLGMGLMSYTAVQMLPVAYVAGMAIALVRQRIPWRRRLNYVGNLAVLAWVALMVFLPLFHLTVEQPEVATSRHSSRIFPPGTSTADQRLDFLRDSAINLLGNFRSSALMFHFYGDVIWITGMPDVPVTDPLTAAFLLLGLAAWLMMMLKSRDPVFPVVPLVMFLMLLVPAFALWSPLETPNFMRSNGALPAVFLIAGLPLAVFCREINYALPKPISMLAVMAVSLGAVAYAAQYNFDVYFDRYTNNYLQQAHPHFQAGKVLRGFVDSGGDYGNAFVIYSAHWWDTRAVGMEAGKPTFFNAPWPKEVPQFLRRALSRSDDLRLDPDRDLLFFYSHSNNEAPILLSEWFPQGRPLKHDLELASKSFYTYRVPALGRDALTEFLDANA